MTKVFAVPGLLLWLCWFGPFQLAAQTLPDSIFSRVSALSGPQEKADYLNETAIPFLMRNDTTAFAMFALAMEISRDAGYVRGEMDALNRTGVLHFRLADYPAAIGQYQQMLDLAVEERDTSYALKGMGNIASAQIEMAAYVPAMQTLLAIIPWIEKINPENVALKYVDLSNVYFYLEQYDKCIGAGMEAMHKGEKYGDLRAADHGRNTVGAAYAELQQIDSARKYLRQSIAFRRETGDILGMMITQMNFASIYHLEGKPDSSSMILKEVIRVADSIGARMQLHIARLNLGMDLKDRGAYKEADAYFEQAFQGFAELGALDKQVEAAQSLALNADKSGDYKKASHYWNTAKSLGDSLFKQELAESVAEMETKYETEKVKKENALLVNEQLRLQQETRILLWSGAGIVAFLLLIFAFWTRIRRLRRRAREEQAMSRALFEGEQKERVRIARDLHDSIGQMLSVVRMRLSGLESASAAEVEQAIPESTALVDKTLDEVRTISHNLMPEALNFGLVSALEDLAMQLSALGEAEVSFEAGSGLREMALARDKALPVYRIVQEVSQNMLKHARATQIGISLYLQDDRLQLVLQDNGQGFHPEKVMEASGIGWRNIVARVHLLKGKIKVRSGNGSGTEILISLPA